ncbi:MAG TPA: alpha/beta fold hydrolase, partial [Methanomicrobiales archaeon]|nr:alpha/beta fold hydrolase [Methanomicrobiales archaeon]
LFYRDVCEERMERSLIPYEGAFLTALRIPAVEESAQKRTLLIHGGFDSLMEEFYSWALYFSERGYEVILFEGPGQGAALRKYGLPLTYEWERPTGAILDHFHRDDVTLLGISMGGYLCLRAAAFEPRISRVIASSIAFDYMQIPPLPIQFLARALLRSPALMNYLSGFKMSDPQERWGIHNLMFITRTETPCEAGRELLQFSEENLHSERVIQDVLILTGAEDHFIPLKMHYKQVAALKNARSVTARIFTREEQAENHCQIGNIGLALDTMAGWIEEKRSVPSRSR